ncbi:MAG: hypothetical protein ABIV25_00345 [Paracoccaceae bacterium]
MDIISKRSGPREEDKHAKAHVRQNWGTIEKLADQISGGSYSANKARVGGKKDGPQASGLIFVDQKARPRVDVPEPYLRISLNGRVVLVDKNSGIQLHFLGQLKRHNGVVRFEIATKANGYISALDPDLEALILDLADKPVDRAYTEDSLSCDLKSRLSLD